MIKLNTKYLKAIDAFVDKWSIEDWVFYNKIPEYDPLIQSILELHGKYLYESNAHEIVQMCFYPVASKINESEKDLTEEEPALKKEFKDSLISALESYPRRYVARFQLPAFPAWGEFEFVISDNIKLVSGHHDFGSLTKNLAEGKPQRLAELLRIKETPTSVFLQIEVDGYGTGEADSPATAKAISLAKQCAFLLTVFGLMHKTYMHGIKALATIQHTESDSILLVDLPDAMADCFVMKPFESNLKIYDAKYAKKGIATTILTDPGRPPETKEEKITAFESLLFSPSYFFKRSNHPDFPSITAAIEWYQDSVFSDNQTFSYLAACIGLEAILGTDDHMNEMSNRLVDRYATLLGKGRTQRNALAKDYADILKLRGQIVHAKEARLTTKHQAALVKIKTMLLNVIWHELHLMIKDEQH